MAALPCAFSVGLRSTSWLDWVRKNTAAEGVPNVCGFLPASNKNKNKTKIVCMLQSNKLGIVGVGERHPEAELGRSQSFPGGFGQ